MEDNRGDKDEDKGCVLCKSQWLSRMFMQVAGGSTEVARALNGTPLTPPQARLNHSTEM